MMEGWNETNSSCSDSLTRQSFVSSSGCNSTLGSIVTPKKVVVLRRGKTDKSLEEIFENNSQEDPDDLGKSKNGSRSLEERTRKYQEVRARIFGAGPPSGIRDSEKNKPASMVPRVSGCLVPVQADDRNDPAYIRNHGLRPPQPPPPPLPRLPPPPPPLSVCSVLPCASHPALSHGLLYGRNPSLQGTVFSSSVTPIPNYMGRSRLCDQNIGINETFLRQQDPTFYTGVGQSFNVDQLEEAVAFTGGFQSYGYIYPDPQISYTSNVDGILQPPSINSGGVRSCFGFLPGDGLSNQLDIYNSNEGAVNCFDQPQHISAMDDPCGEFETSNTMVLDETAGVNGPVGYLLNCETSAQIQYHFDNMSVNPFMSGNGAVTDNALFRTTDFFLPTATSSQTCKINEKIVIPRDTETEFTENLGSPMHYSLQDESVVSKNDTTEPTVINATDCSGRSVSLNSKGVTSRPFCSRSYEKINAKDSRIQFSNRRKKGTVKLEPEKIDASQKTVGPAGSFSGPARDQNTRQESRPGFNFQNVVGDPDFCRDISRFERRFLRACDDEVPSTEYHRVQTYDTEFPPL